MRLLPFVLAVSLMGAVNDPPPLVDAALIHAALIHAAKSGDRDTLRTLIQKKADVNAVDGDGSTALHWASYRDDLESADLLLQIGRAHV